MRIEGRIVNGNFVVRQLPHRVLYNVCVNVLVFSIFFPFVTLVKLTAEGNRLAQYYYYYYYYIPTVSLPKGSRPLPQPMHTVHMTFILYTYTIFYP